MGRPATGGPRRIFGPVVGNCWGWSVVHGGVKVYRGNPAAARNYVEADHARVDDYYLAERTGLAERFVATLDGVEAVGPLDGDGYEAWVARLDPLSREPRGRVRQDASAVRFVEVIVNGPKTWSLAAALDPGIAEAYDAAQDRAARQIIGWLAQHATTRIGPRGRQVQVPVERIEAATVRHYTSRAGDPQRHLHLQINARVWAEGKWRCLHTVGVRDMIDAINGIGHAAVMCDPQFRKALADGGFTLDSQTGEVNELAGFAGSFSARARQIGKNIERYEAAWRDAHPGEEPGPDLLRTWDRRAWSEARPDKVVPTDGTVLTDGWIDELHRLGFRSPTGPTALHAARTGALDRDAAVNTVLSRLGAKRSAWNAADIRGQVELLISSKGMIADPSVRIELAEDLTARAVAASVPLLGDTIPEHIRALTSRDVLSVEADLSNSFTVRALVTIADETGARLALVGDRHQLPAVGRGGVLDLAAHWADPDARMTLDNVHRFADPDYAKLSLAMRSGENPEAVFDLLVQRGQIVVHSDEASRTAASPA